MIRTGQGLGSLCLLVRHVYDYLVYLLVTSKLKVRVKKGVRIRFSVRVRARQGLGLVVE